MSKDKALELVESMGQEVCEKVDKLAYDLLAKNGYDYSNYKKCKKALKDNDLGLVFNSVFKDEFLQVWWTINKFEKNKQKEEIDKSTRIQFKFRKVEVNDD